MTKLEQTIITLAQGHFDKIESLMNKKNFPDWFEDKAISLGMTIEEFILDRLGTSIQQINTIAALANNFRKAVKVKPGGHTYYAAVNQQEYGETHPEYYALIDGVRKNAD